jgi:small subunit ribosomal protein S2
MMFVLDAVKEKIAILEARRLGITVVAPLDTNCDPDLVDFPIPGNDDAIRSIQLFCNEMAAAMNEGKAEFNGDAGEAEQVAEVSADEQAEVVAEAVAEEGK